MVGFIQDQWTRLPDTAKDLTGKTVIVVGANVGLGFEGLLFDRLTHVGKTLTKYNAAAKKLANMNPAKLILACRNQSKGDEAVACWSFSFSTGTSANDAA